MKDKIFGIGLPRTGTTSLAKALRILGYSGENYCMLHDDRTNDPTIIESEDIDTSFMIDNSYYKNYKELLLENEHSKFILTIRDISSWRDSVANFQTTRIASDTTVLPNIITYMQEVMKHFNDKGALNQLLVVDLFDEGCDCECKWKNLYEFLGIKPKNSLGEFPHIISYWE